MISVCIASFNGEEYLKEQVDSILIQLKEEDELIISDDGSTDRTLDILRSYKDSRIRIICNQEHHGVNGNFSNALIHAKGDYIFLSDQDDIWLPNKINICCQQLEHYDCVIHDAVVVDKDLQVVSESFFTDIHSYPGFVKNLIRNTFIGCCMAFKREILEDILPIPNTDAFFHDWWIGSLATLKYSVTFISYRGILFRRHDNNNSCTAQKSKFSRFRQLRNRIIQIYYLLGKLVG